MSNTESYSVSDCCVCDNCMKLPGGGGNSSELAKYLLALAGSSLLFAAQADTVAWWRFRRSRTQSRYLATRTARYRTSARYGRARSRPSARDASMRPRREWSRPSCGGLSPPGSPIRRNAPTSPANACSRRMNFRPEGRSASPSRPATASDCPAAPWPRRSHTAGSAFGGLSTPARI